LLLRNSILRKPATSFPKKFSVMELYFEVGTFFLLFYLSFGGFYSLFGFVFIFVISLGIFITLVLSLGIEAFF
jgi:hypothetical protein